MSVFERFWVFLDPLFSFHNERSLEVFVAIARWNIIAISFLLWRRKKRGLVLPNPDDPDVLYSEKSASVTSYKNIFTRFGGASNCMILMVTRTHLAIASYFPFSAFFGFSDLEHLIPSKNINAVSQKWWRLTIEFRVPTGTRTIDVWSWKRGQLLKALADSGEIGCAINAQS